TLEVSNYLWKELDLPYVLPESVIPDTSWQRQVDDLEPPVLEQLLVQTRNSHPKLLSYRYKVDLLSIEQKLKFQGLLPQLDLKAHILDKGYQWTNNLSNSLLEKNYRFGVDFSLPLRLSEGRGAYQQARLKKSAAQLEVNLQEWWIENKVKSYYNEVMMLRQQIQITENALGNFQKLLEGETLRFRSGESTVFLMNQRELKVLDYQQKFQELRTKYLKSYVALSWSAGQLR
ncbi:MAG: TolC family protein, partial [Chitinophagaceae bacterium]